MEKKVNGIVFKTVPKEWDVYFDMALAMLDEIMKNNELGKKTVMIVPGISKVKKKFAPPLTKTTTPKTNPNHPP